jgi:hypothetical protein
MTKFGTRPDRYCEGMCGPEVYVLVFLRTVHAKLHILGGLVFLWDLKPCAVKKSRQAGRQTDGENLQLIVQTK